MSMQAVTIGASKELPAGNAVEVEVTNESVGKKESVEQ
jgi:hypothetical protein